MRKAVAMAFAMAFGAALILSSSAWAAPPAEVSKDDYLKAIHQACPTTYVKAADGTSEPVLNCSRGFSLATGAPAAGGKTAGPKASGAPVAPQGHVHRQVASASAPSSRLSNLLIHFKLGSAELTPAGEANAANFAAALRDSSVAALKFEIAGHTDATGAKDRNQTLSEQRADAVRTYLVSQGVDASRLTSHGYGSSQLAQPNAPKSAANRRVEARPL